MKTKAEKKAEKKTKKAKADPSTPAVEQVFEGAKEAEKTFDEFLANIDQEDDVPTQVAI